MLAVIEKYIEPVAKYGGIVAVSFEWLAILLFYLLQPAAFIGDRPISYFATLPQTRLIFGLCFSIAAISFWIFTRYHLSKRYAISTKLFSLSMLGFAAVAIIPFDPNSTISATIHVVLAQIFSLSFLAGIYFTARKSEDNGFRRISMALAITSMIFLLSFLALPKDSPLILMFEIAAGVMGQLWIIWITFHSRKRETI